ncbi:hypothetical protein ACVIWV_007752 [Bradyrhizobium diazoefficiens]|jgi:hypothetical protein|uniref:Uncharacterized protein n=2 Tax=Nitrobacteraceae TaxID=41294 RepID=A0A0E4BNY0_9BRAD|nr:hypothetical protein [Bradyrhizobium diazoefficiens]MBR0860767.1 hypothetical protein [Bradyrhizobium diazoefficiens]MBR0885258.1 hypothetical protein [Bradyrhizobium diazoefficiens]MBR0916853.1 hypothetical protein [Bradyrhizobium diazoefficiens]BAR57002.1 hypothetical protein NK6_3828 [Bradyrhizobium diazoefficiens]
MSPKDENSLYGRGISKLKLGDRAGGEEDINAAKAISSSVADDFKKLGIR